MNETLSKSDTPLYKSVGFVMIRAPLLPCDVPRQLLDVQFEDISSSPSTEDHANDCNDAFERSRLTMRKRLQEKLADPAIQEAILIGSPELFQAIPRWQKSPDSKKGRQAQANLLRYLIRMATRPTPFGLFAGVALGHIGPMMDLHLGPLEHNRKRTRPDMQWLLYLVRVLEQRPEVIECVRFFTNSMAFISGGRLYLPHLDVYGQAETDKMVSLRATPAVIRALARARNGVTINDLKQDLLAERPDATEAQVQMLLSGLREQGAIHSDLRPALTGEDPIRYILGKIGGIPGCDDVYEQLQTALALSRAYDEQLVGEGITTFQYLSKSMANPDSKIHSTIEVDMVTACTLHTFSETVAQEIARAAEVLLCLSTFPLQFPHLSAYRREFVERYGAEREVPLLELLDENIGLGPPPTYQAPPRTRESPIFPLPQQPPMRDRALSELVATALRNRQIEIELDKETLSRLQVHESWKEAIPDSLELYVSVAARSQIDINSGNYQLIIGPRTSAQPAGCSFGRFCDILGEESIQSLTRLAREEETCHPDKIFAELVYLPSQGHAANVAIRPSTRNYEVVVACTASVEHNNVIPLDDLVVGIENERFYLRSISRNAEVVIRNTHLLNYSAVKAPNECRFLAEASFEGTIAPVTFDWGAASQLLFLPRVRVGRTILCPATWHLPARKIGTKSRPDSEGWYKCIQNWRQEWDVPRYVYLSQGDNRLLVDLQNPNCVEDLGNECRKYAASQGVITLQEMLPGFEHAWAKGPSSRHLLEFVVPLKRNQQLALPQMRLKPYPVVTLEHRLRPLGSDWIYAKLYAGHARHDDLLAGPVREFVDQTLSSGLIGGWFFIRYADPESHLRVRLQGEQTHMLTQLLPALVTWSRSLVDRGLLRKIAFDTYDREIERYGGLESVEIAERIFGVDSFFATDIMALRLQKALDLAPLDLAILTTDSFVFNLGLTLDERLSLYRAARKAQEPFFRNHIGRLAKTFFDYRKTAQRLLGDRDWLRTRPGGIRLEACVNTRAAKLEPIGRQWRTLSAQNKLLTSEVSFLSSCIHMHYNRLFGTNRLLEFEATYILERTLDSLQQYVPNGIHIV